MYCELGNSKGKSKIKNIRMSLWWLMTVTLFSGAGMTSLQQAQLSTDKIWVREMMTFLITYEFQIDTLLTIFWLICNNHSRYDHEQVWCQMVLMQKHDSLERNCIKVLSWLLQFSTRNDYESVQYRSPQHNLLQIQSDSRICWWL